MALIASILLAWLVLTLVLIARRAGVLRALWHEPMLARPVVIVESDDWGPGPARDAAVLARVAALLDQIRDADGHPAGVPPGRLPEMVDHAHRGRTQPLRSSGHALSASGRAACSAGMVRTRL